MADVLIVVERSASDHPDIIGTMIQKDLRSFFDALQLNAEQIPEQLRQPPVEIVANHGMAATVSLTSIVLATALQQRGITFSIFDDDAIVDSHGPTFLEHVRRAKVIAVSTTYIIARKHIRNLIETIRSVAPNTPLVLGGQGILALKLDPHSENDAKMFSQIDAVVYGDGENSFPLVVSDLLTGERSARRGVLYRTGNEWKGSTEPEMADLEHAAVPNYAIIRDYEINGRMLPKDFRPGYAALEEGRGCAFKCRFCSYHVYSPFRRKSPARIVAELQAVKRAGFENVSYVGAEFIAPIKQSKAVLEAIRDADLGMGIWLYARLDLVARHRELFGALKDAGVTHLVFGMESGDENILLAMKKYYEVEGMIEGARDARKLGFELMSSIIIGYPGENEETIGRTIDVLNRCNFHTVFLHALNVLPDTPLWDMREEFGIKIGATGYWSHKTMALGQIPGAVRRVMGDVHRGSDSVFINVIRNLAPGFVRPGKDYTDEKLVRVSKVLQDILCEQWSAPGVPELA